MADLGYILTEDGNIITDELGNPLLVEGPGAYLISPGIPVELSGNAGPIAILPNYPNAPAQLSQDNLTVDVSRGRASPNYPLEVWRSL